MGNLARGHGEANAPAGHAGADAPLNLAMVDHAFRCHGAAMQTTEESVRLIQIAQTVELMAFSPDGDPLALAPIAKAEALALIAMPVTMGHIFRASRVRDGRVFVEAVESDGRAKR